MPPRRLAPDPTQPPLTFGLAAPLDVQQLVRVLVVDLERRVGDPEAVARAAASSSRRMRWQSSPGATSTWAASAGKPEVTSQTWRSWTSTTPGGAASARPIALGVDARGGALEQHPARVAQQAPGGAQHQRGDEQRGDRVGRASKPTAARAAPASAAPSDA